METPETRLQETILGCLMSWPEEIDIVSSIIAPDDFYSEKYRIVYQYLLENEGGDFVTISTALKGKVPANELAEWIGFEATAVFLPRYCKELKELSDKRKLFDMLGRVRIMAAEKTSQEMLEALEVSISSMNKNQATEPTTSRELVMDATRRLKQRYTNKGKLQGISYGIEQLDEVTCGMHPGELIIVAGRPSMGKSAFAGNILENICLAGYSGILFTLEMDKGNCMDRLLSGRSNVLYKRLRTGNIHDVDWPRLVKASNDLTQCRLFMDDTPAITLREIKLKCRKLKKDGLDVVVIDYLQLMGMNVSILNKVQAIGEISRGLKQMARELDCAVVLLSQLNRGLENRPDKRPIMSDLRDSGEIEQDADVILFPFRPAAYCQKCKDGIDNEEHNLEQHKRTAEIIVEKQRNGERNISVPLTWWGEVQKFIA